MEENKKLNPSDIIDLHTKVRHIRSGHVYTVVCSDARLEADETPVVVYSRISQDEAHKPETWVRYANEFYDGRFEIVEPAGFGADWTEATTPPPLDSKHYLHDPSSRAIELRWEGFDDNVTRAVYLPDPHYGGRWHGDHDPVYSCEWWPANDAKAPTHWRFAKQEGEES